MTSRILLSIVSLLLSLSAMAHAVWIETDTKATSGKPQTVKVYFGEYNSGKPDSTARWFSNLRDMQLFVTAPDGSRSPLRLVQEADHYAASFTPAATGTYLLSIAHTVADLFREGKLEYYATTSVIVQNGTKSGLVSATALAVQPLSIELKKNQPFTSAVYFNRSPVPGAKIILDGPKGWTKNLEADPSGKASFTPEGAGRYMIEAIHYEDKPGSHNNKPYKKITHVVTHTVSIE